MLILAGCKSPCFEEATIPSYIKIQAAIVQVNADFNIDSILQRSVEGNPHAFVTAAEKTRLDEALESAGAVRLLEKEATTSSGTSVQLASTPKEPYTKTNNVLSSFAKYFQIYPPTALLTITPWTDIVPGSVLIISSETMNEFLGYSPPTPGIFDYVNPPAQYADRVTRVSNMFASPSVPIPMFQNLDQYSSVYVPLNRTLLLINHSPTGPSHKRLLVFITASQLY